MDLSPSNTSGLSPNRMVVGIATRGRSSILKSTLESLNLQTRKPDAIVIACTGPEDVNDIQSYFSQVQLLFSLPGLTRQRNTIIDNLPNTDFLVFLDDDFHLHPNYLQMMEKVFTTYPDVVAATGTLLGDGIHGRALESDEAALKFKSHYVNNGYLAVSPIFNAYGCNMVFRMEIITKQTLRFDENLPLYGWYEDVDFSRRVSRHGRAVRVNQAWGVHLGVKSGRHSEVRLGYSQIANPIYLAQKKSVPWHFAIASFCSRSLKNLVRSLAPESHIDRRGRLRGNLLAYRDLCKGILSPTRVNHM